MNTIADFLRFSQTSRLSISDDVWVIWDEDKNMWVVYFYVDTYVKFESESEKDLVDWLKYNV
jgi:hypothetical protein